MTRPDGVRPWTRSEVKTGPDREQWRRCRPRRLGGGLASPSGSCFHGEVNVSSPHHCFCAEQCAAWRPGKTSGTKRQGVLSTSKQD